MKLWRLGDMFIFLHVLSHSVLGRAACECEAQVQLSQSSVKVNKRCHISTSSRHKYPGWYVVDMLRDMRLMGTTLDEFAEQSLPEDVSPLTRRLLCVRVWVKEW